MPHSVVADSLSLYAYSAYTYVTDRGVQFTHFELRQPKFRRHVTLTVIYKVNYTKSVTVVLLFLIIFNCERGIMLILLSIPTEDIKTVCKTG